jgi:pyrophosphatase PpaX
MAGNITARSKIHAILFDLDGTLIDSNEMANRALERLHGTYLGARLSVEQMQKFRGMPTRKIMACIDPDRVDELLIECAAIENEIRHLSRLYPGVIGLLNYIRDARIPIGVVTAQSKIELEGLRGYFGLDEFVQVWICSDDVAKPKPHPSAVLRALDSLGCAPSQAIMVGDSKFDMEAGKRAGACLGAALWGLEDYKEILRYKPDHVFYRPDEIIKYFDEQTR